MPLSPADEAILRRMIADYRRYGIKKGAVAPIQVFEEVDGQKLGIDLGAIGGVLCDYNVTGLVGSTVGTPAGPSQQWLGDETKGIYGGSLYISGGETVSTFYPSAAGTTWNTNLARFEQFDGATVGTTFGTTWPYLRAFGYGTPYNAIFAASTSGWTDSTMCGWLGTVVGVGAVASVITGYGQNSTSGNTVGVGYARTVFGGTVTQGLPRANQFVIYGDTRVGVTGAPFGLASQYVVDDGQNRWHGGTATYSGARYYGGLFIDVVSPPPVSPPPGPVTPPVPPSPPVIPPVSPPPPTSPPVVPPITSPVLPGGGTVELVNERLSPPPPPPVAIGRQIADADTDVHLWLGIGRIIRWSPNGTAYQLVVDNAGNFSSSLISTTPGEV